MAFSVANVHKGKTISFFSSFPHAFIIQFIYKSANEEINRIKVSSLGFACLQNDCTVRSWVIRCLSWLLPSFCTWKPAKVKALPDLATFQHRWKVLHSRLRESLRRFGVRIRLEGEVPREGEPRNHRNRGIRYSIFIKTQLKAKPKKKKRKCWVCLCHFKDYQTVKNDPYAASLRIRAYP